MKTRDKIDLGFLIIEAVMFIVNIFKKESKPKYRPTDNGVDIRENWKDEDIHNG